MSKKILTSLAIAYLTAYSSVGTASELGYKEDELLVCFAPKAPGIQRSTTEKNEILRSLGLGTIKRDYRVVPGLSLVKLPSGQKVQDALKTFNRTNGILYAEPNYKIKLLSTFPNDTRFNELWGMHNTGQPHPLEGGGTSFGTADADIDAPEGWEISTGSGDVVIAIIDEGVDLTHEDLVNKLVGGWDFACKLCPKLL